jgi:proteasome lid subunit RPN8/RPN11
MDDRSAKPARRLPNLHGSVAQQLVDGLRATNTDSVLTASRDLFERTLSGLRDRSRGWRESAAIWSGRVTNGETLWRAERVDFHHELGDDRAGPLRLELSESAKFELYRELNKAGLRLVALLHTHPNEWVEHSFVDARNQICGRVGFWSLVIPWYGREPWQIQAFGIHTRVDRGWRRLRSGEIQRRVHIEE